jgi:hypothetical protein
VSRLSVPPVGDVPAGAQRMLEEVGAQLGPATTGISFERISDLVACGKT